MEISVSQSSQPGNHHTLTRSAGARISALFVIMIISTCATAFPVLATRIRKLKIPVYVYLFARYFGSGVIVATGFIQ